MKFFKKKRRKSEPVKEKDLPTFILNNYRAEAQRKRVDAEAALAEAQQCR